MAEELEKAYRQFLKDIRDRKTAANYLDETALEDEYSHSEIYKAHKVFMDQIKSFLRMNYPDTYIVYSDWCVHVLTIDEAERKGMRIIQSYLA